MAPRSTLGANPFFIVGRDEATGATFVRTPTACPTSFVEPIDLFGFVSPRRVKITDDRVLATTGDKGVAALETQCSAALQAALTKAPVRFRVAFVAATYEDDAVGWPVFGWYIVTLSSDGKRSVTTSYNEDLRRSSAYAEAKLARSEEQRRVNQEASRRASEARWDSFRRQYDVETDVSGADLFSNPFPHKGKVISTRLAFERMLSENTALAHFGRSVFVLVGLAPDQFRASRDIPDYFAVRFLGMEEINLPVIGNTSVPKLEVVGLHVCSDSPCSELTAFTKK
jgi:hypothetical protein